MTTTVTSTPLNRVAALTPLWIVLGTLGSIGLAIFGTVIGALPRPGSNTWWFNLDGVNNTAAHLGFYGSVVLVLLGWLGLGAYARLGRLSIAKSWGVLICWATPLFVGPPIWSRDLYSYVGQGDLAHRGLNPYKVSPSALGPGTTLSSISSVWQHTTSPYGPFFVMIGKQLSMIGEPIIEQLLVYRAVELIGVALIMIAVPPLAKRLGNDPGIALWLAALSPLALWSFVASGHNDTLMIGLMITGIAVAKSGKLWAGIALCALAATIKLPAVGAVVFLAAEPLLSADKKQRWKIIGEAVLIPIFIIIGITVVAGLGFDWLGPAALKIPTEITVLSTPLVSLGNFLGSILHAIGLPISVHTTISVVRLIGSIATFAGILYLLFHVRNHEVVRLIGVALLVLVIGSPTVWPWYLMWAIVVLAVTSVQRSKALAALSAFPMLVVGAGGTPILNGWMVWVTGPLMVLGLVYLFWNQHWKAGIGEPKDV